MSRTPSEEFEPHDEDAQSTERSPLHVEGYGFKLPVPSGGSGTEDVAWKDVPKIILGHLKTLVLAVTGLPHDVVQVTRTGLQGMTRYMQGQGSLPRDYAKRVARTREEVDGDLEERQRRINTDRLVRSKGDKSLPGPNVNPERAERARRAILELIAKKKKQGFHASILVTKEEHIVIRFVREGTEDFALELADYTLGEAQDILDRNEPDPTGDEDDGDDSYPTNKEDRD